MNKAKRFGWLSLILLFAASSVMAQGGDGIFPNLDDVGEPDAAGFLFFEEGLYSLEGVGESLGNETLVDQFTFLNTEISGSFIIEAFPDIPGENGRGGVMIRQNLDPGSIHTSLMTEADFQTFPTFRTLPNGGSVIDGNPEPPEQLKMRLVKLGGSVHYFLVDENGDAEFLQTEAAQFQDPVRTGLAVFSGGSGTISVFDFTEVELTELPLTVSREIPAETFEPGATISGITLTATVREGETASTTVTEVVPQGATITLGDNTDGTVTMNGDGTFDWVLDGLTGEATLTYEVTLPEEGFSAVWKGTFTDEQFSDLQNFLAGDALLPPNPEFRDDGPFEVDLFFPGIIQAEQGAITEGGEEDLYLMYDPRTSNGISVVAVDDFVESSLLQFTLNIPEDGTYFIFGNAREEDGNSDSFHANMDAVPEGTDASRWNINDGDEKQFNIQWVSREDPSEDPRPFELTAGEHTFNLAGREDSAQLDWIAVTNNPGLNLEVFDPNITVIAGRVIDDPFLERGETETSVELSFVFRDIEESFIVQEVPPSGFEVSNIETSSGAATLNDDGSISWDITGLTNQQLTLTYTVTAPAVEGNTFRSALFDGNMLIGEDEPQEVPGDDSIVLEANPIDPTGKTTFFFQNVGADAFQDNLMESHLRNQFGLEIVEFDDGDDPGFERPPNLDGSDMAIVSGSVGSGNIAEMNYHVNDDEALITFESFLFDDFAFTPNFDFTDGVELEIVDNEHPITQGLDLGPLRVHTEEDGIAWADNPPEGVRILATPVGEPNHAAVWVIEAGSEVDGMVIPGIRLGLWTGTFTNLNNQGIDLMNRIIAYSLGEEPPAPPTKVSNFMLY